MIYCTLAHFFIPTQLPGAGITGFIERAIINSRVFIPTFIWVQMGCGDSAASAKNWPVNACGLVTIDSPNRASGFSATDTVKINGTQYSVSAILIATKPPICRNGVLYQST
jgi:hypothetical protein